jgi:hypothetical protein
VTVGAAGFLVDVFFAEADERGRSAGAGRASTVFLEQMGQSAVKRLWRQKSELIGSPTIRALPRCPAC